MVFSLVLAIALIAPATAGACPFYEAWCSVPQAIGGAISGVAGDAITALAKAVVGALVKAIEWASTLWVGVGRRRSRTLPDSGPGWSRLQQNLLVYTTGLAVMCTLLGAARIVYHEHKAAQLRDLGRTWRPTCWCRPRPPGARRADRRVRSAGVG